MANLCPTLSRSVGLPLTLLLLAAAACQRPAPPPGPERDPASGTTAEPGAPAPEGPGSGDAGRDQDGAEERPEAPAPRPSEPDGGPEGSVHGGSVQSGPVQKDRPGSGPRPFAGTAGRSERRASGEGIGQLVGVRAARHDGFDRVVFQFSDHVPGYAIEYIDRPVRACGSGDVVPLPGDGWLQVQLSPARAHTDEGKPTVIERRQAVNSTTLLELASTCDFEGYVTWVLGVRAPNRYRVLELDAPPRLAVDVLH